MRLMKMNTNRNAAAGSSRNQSKGRFGRGAAVFSVVAMVSGLSVLIAPAANAAALTTVNWTLSNNQVGVAAIYGYSFRTATTGSISTITFTFSGAGPTGSPGIAKAYGIKAGTV